MDRQILKLVLTRDKPGLTKNSWFSGSTKYYRLYCRMLLVKSFHCKNRERQISKQVPSTTTGVTWYTDRAAAPPKPAQCCEKRAGAESSLGAAPGPGRRTLVCWSNRRAAAAGAAQRSQAWKAGPRPAGTALNGGSGLKKQKRA